MNDWIDYTCFGFSIIPNFLQTSYTTESITIAIMECNDIHSYPDTCKFAHQHLRLHFRAGTEMLAQCTRLPTTQIQKRESGDET